MKQYTSKTQTQRLIELGFPEPNSVSETPKYYDDGYEYDYSIGELLEILDGYMTEPTDELLVWRDMLFWYVRFASDMECSCYDTELVCALFNYIVELKEDVEYDRIGKKE